MAFSRQAEGTGPLTPQAPGAERSTHKPRVEKNELFVTWGCAVGDLVTKDGAGALRSSILS